MSYKSEFQSNNNDLQTILDMVNGLDDAPSEAEPCTEEHASELANELSTQDNLIAQIKTALISKGYMT